MTDQEKLEFFEKVKNNKIRKLFWKNMKPDMYFVPKTLDLVNDRMHGDFYNYHTDWESGYASIDNGFLPASIQKFTWERCDELEGCACDWTLYKGFSDEYEFCKKCDRVKFSEWENFKKKDAS